MKHNSTFLRCTLCSVFFMVMWVTATAQPLLTYSTHVNNLDYPVDMVHPGDGSDRMFIVQQNGIIRMYKNSTLSVFMDISSMITFSDERGLLSMAFHPDYDGINNRYFFLYYTSTAGSITTIHVTRFETAVDNPDQGDPLTASEVIAIDKPATFTNHNGGKLNFGSDGMLYFGTGDGGSGNDPLNNAQNGQSLLGKMIRIDINGSTGTTPLYSIPPDNPFLAANDPTDAIRDEIWALGLRNPFRWSFDAATGAMYIGDVGQGVREEVDIVMPSPTTGGVNYGWRCLEGTLPTPGVPACSPGAGTYVAPAFEYGHDASGGFAITGGYVYHGTLSPILQGYYIFSDYVSGNVWVRSSAGLTTRQPTQVGGIAAFGLDLNGELYAVVRGSAAGQGTVLHLSASIVLPVSLVRFTGTVRSGYHELTWTSSSEQHLDRYIVEYSTDGIHYSTAGEVLATNNANGSTYSFQHPVSTGARYFYRLRMRDIDGAARYSMIIQVGSAATGDTKVFPTIVRDGRVTISSSENIRAMRVIDLQGKVCFASAPVGQQGFFSIPVPSLAPGLYIVSIQTGTRTINEKIIIQ